MNGYIPGDLTLMDMCVTHRTRHIKKDYVSTVSVGGLLAKMAKMVRTVAISGRHQGGCAVDSKRKESINEDLPDETVSELRRTLR